MVVTCLYVDRTEGTGTAGLLAFLPISESNPKFEDRLQSGQDGMREWTSKIALHLIICKLMYKNVYVLGNSKDTIENAAFGLRTTQKTKCKTCVIRKPPSKYTAQEIV